jgi:hypothetical protein
MTEIQLILQLIIAHLLSDFILQPQSWSDKKEAKVLTIHHFYHIIVVGVLSYILSLDINFWIAAIILTVLHFFSDILKSWLISRDRTKDYFFIDQIIHLSAIIGVVLVYSCFSNITFLFDAGIKAVAIVTGFVFCAKPANIIIKFLLKSFSIAISDDAGGSPDDMSLPNAGKLIGITERFLALSLILLGQYEAVGLIIAAKSILRFSGAKQSEYVLVGTLLSFGIAVFTGILINFLN